MTSAFTSRLDGAVTGLAIKAPVRMASTENLTLSGVQTVDGVSGAAGDRVLVKNQSTTSENGIYEMAVGAWTRTADFSGTRDAAQGTLVLVLSGAIHAGQFWRVSTSAPVIGSALAWEQWEPTVATSLNNVKTFLADELGMVPDGVTDNVVGLPSALAYASANGPARVLCSGGVYAFSDEVGSISDASNVTLDLAGSRFDFSGVAFGVIGNGKEMLHIAGAYSGTALTLSSDAVRGAKTLALTTSSLSAGDWMRVYSASVWDQDRTGAKRGELVKIASVDSGSQVTLTAPLADDYATADSAAAEKITMVENFSIENGELMGNRSDLTENLHEGIRITAGVNCHVRKMRTSDFGIVHIRLTDCVLSSVTDCDLERAYDDSSAYGVSCTDAAQDCVVSGNRFREVRHAFTTNSNVSTSYGITRRIQVAHNKIFGSVVNIGGSSGDVLDTHAGSENVDFLYNELYGCRGQGINVEGVSARIIGNRIDGTESHGIQCQPYSDVRGGTFLIEGNVLRRIGSGTSSSNTRGILVTNKATTSPINNKSVIVRGNDVESKNEAIYIDSTDSVIVDGGRYVLRIGDSLVTPASNLGLHAVRIDGCGKVGVTNIEAVGQTIALNLTGNTRARVAACDLECQLTSSSNNCIVASITTPQTSFVGNAVKFTGTTSGSTTGVVLSAAANSSTVIGNTIEDCATAAVTDSSTGSSVANNTTI